MSADDLILFKDDPSGTHDEGLLGHTEALNTFRLSLRALPPPACVAVYGSWGSGKTTLLRRAQKTWQGGPTVWFDPWEYERRPDLISPLLHAILGAAKELREDPNRWAEAKRLAVGIARTTLSLATRVGLAYAFGGVLSPDLSLSSLAAIKPEDYEKNFDALEKYHDEIDEVKTSFRDLVTRVVDAYAKSKPETGKDARLVIFLDDVDRCLPDNVVALIEGVKLLLCSRTDCRVVFVFALDREVVGEAIRNRYPGSSTYTGESYLEKIFDLSLEVPPVRQTHLRKLIARQFEASPALLGRLKAALRTGDEESGIETLAAVLSEPAFANPRVIKRTLNRLSLLVSSSAGERRVQGAENMRRFLAWVAGAERFRTFRYFFPAATYAEISEIWKPASATPRIAAMAGGPQFRSYLKMLEPVNEAEQLPTPGGGLRTLRDFDDLLRSAGL